MPFSETCFSELAWAFLCKFQSSMRDAAAQIGLHAPSLCHQNESFLRKKLYFCRRRASVCQPEPPPFAPHQHNYIEKKRIDNGKLEI